MSSDWRTLRYAGAVALVVGCCGIANAAELGRDDIFLSESTYFYGGGRCC